VIFICDQLVLNHFLKLTPTQKRTRRHIKNNNNLSDVRSRYIFYASEVS